MRPDQKLEGHFVISHVSELGEPLQPREHARKFVNQCVVLVRDNIPITIREWKKTSDDQVSYVSEREKDQLWNDLTAHFELPGKTEELFKSCAMKKMATQF